MEALALRPVDAVAVTTLVDNVTDSLLPDQGPASRPSTAAAPRIPVALFVGGETDDALRAEHGFSALVTVTDGGRDTRILFDAGRTPDGLVGNMRRLRIDPRDIDAIVLSHGHWDHVTGMEGLARRLGRANLPVLIHPEFWSRRRIAFPGGREPFELPTASAAALRGAGFEIVEDRRPSFLLDGRLLVTGEVDRTTAFERGFPGHEAHRPGGWEPDPLILDDQALIALVRDRGLVVLTGCGHAGIVNILRHARALTGGERIHAVVGGFHLTGRAFEPIIAPTCEALAGFAPDHLVPAHCTGWKAQHAIAARFPDAFIPNCVGTRLTFAAVQPPSAGSPSMLRAFFDRR
ncbi:MAG TPA: MBL fold metallo-hydrolase [Miltoncostaeaceae bacterium]|jgi:7,8-dihydropterin-6-yl-methyl-4-(beta-D-ribofuranosyl)aminobenzene 5'-phosphate synthase|nr:MBL fold metallo-hydrolase [Miltoncostaeaceae bacterium]